MPAKNAKSINADEAPAGIRRDILMTKGYERARRKFTRNDQAITAKLNKRVHQLQVNADNLQRKPIKGATRDVFETRVDSNARLIDEPLSRDGAHAVALLHVDEHDKAIAWGKAYDEDTAAYFDASRRRQERRATTIPAPRTDLLASAPPSGLTPPGSEALGETYGAVLTAEDLAAIAVLPDRVVAVLTAHRVEDLASHGVNKQTAEAIDVMYDQKTAAVAVARVVPGHTAPDSMLVSYSELVALQRQPLSAFLSTLSNEQRRIIDRKSDGLLVVRGAAGTGKTVVGIRRIERWIAQRDAFETRAFLFTCFNQVLAKAAHRMLEDTIGDAWDDTRVVVKTAYSVLGRELNRLDPRWKVKPENDRSKLVVAIRLARAGASLPPALSKWTDDEIYDELVDVIFGRALLNRKAYLAADRAGRGAGRQLDEANRIALWRVYQSCRKVWASSGLGPWEQIPARLCGLLERNPRKSPLFAGVVVDEAQDLTPSVLRALLLLQANNDSRFMVLGDAAQNVYRTGFRWKHTGLAVIGRTQTLRKSFRSTGNIIGAAAPLLERQRGRFEEDLVLPRDADEEGPAVSVARLPHGTNELAWVAERVVECVRSGVHPCNIAVLLDSRTDRKTIADALRPHRIDAEDLEKKNGAKSIDLDANSVKLLTPASAKGMEFPTVFVPRVTERRLPSSDSDSESADLARRQLFTAMMRCAWQLTLSSGASVASGLLSELDPRHTQPYRPST